MQWNNVSKAGKILLFIACGICIGIAANWNDEASVGFKSGIDAYSFSNGDECNDSNEKEDSNQKSESSK